MKSSKKILILINEHPANSARKLALHSVSEWMHSFFLSFFQWFSDSIHSFMSFCRFVVKSWYRYIVMSLCRDIVTFWLCDFVALWYCDNVSWCCIHNCKFKNGYTFNYKCCKSTCCVVNNRIEVTLLQGTTCHTSLDEKARSRRMWNRLYGCVGSRIGK